MLPDGPAPGPDDIADVLPEVPNPDVAAVSKLLPDPPSSDPSAVVVLLPEVPSADHEAVAGLLPGTPASDPAVIAGRLPEAPSIPSEDAAALLPGTPETSTEDVAARLPDGPSIDPAALATLLPEAPAANPAAITPLLPDAPGAEPDAITAPPPGLPTEDPSLPPLAAPAFDVIRATSDGQTLVAGTGPVGAEIIALVDGTEVQRDRIDTSGQFVLFLFLDPSVEPRVLTLRAEEGAGVALSEDQIILASVGAPEIADTAPEPAPETATPQPAPEVEIAKNLPAPAEPQPTTVAVLRASEEGVELIQSANPESPEAIDDLALDMIGYSGLGDVQLSGRAGRETVIRVYLDNQAVKDLPAGPDGRWRGLLDGIAPGIYTLRLDAIDPNGTVMSRIETPFKREDPEVLTAINPPRDPLSVETADLIRAVTVQRGDTLWAISRERYGQGILYVRVFEANRDQIRNPDLIYPGQVFSIPN